MSNAVFYHAGCPVCVSAEQQILAIIDRNRVHVDVVHLGEERSRIGEARAAGVQSVPALVLDNQVLHLNFGASLEDVANS